jgi:hypothetical protein
MNASAEFDIIVYGATGFTGQLVAEYLAARDTSHDQIRWAMAGRSLDKLKRVRDAISASADTSLVVADASDPSSLAAMLRQTRSVISNVGPYQLYGSDLVAGCAANGTDYFDLCGEAVWMRQMIDRHEAAAKASGARIMFSSGFDSVPFELGTFFLQEEARRVFGAPASRVKGRVRGGTLSLSGGTAASARDVRGGRKGFEPGYDIEGSICSDTGIQGRQAAAGKQARLRGRPAILGRAVYDGDTQHPQRPSLQYADGFSIRDGVRLRRDGAHRAGRERRSRRQGCGRRQFRQDRPPCTEARRRTDEGRARGRQLRSALRRDRARRPQRPRIGEG